MPYDILLADLARQHLQGFRAYDRQTILEEMEEQLHHQPTVATKNRKRLDTVVPNFAYDPPIWELRVGEFRVFYDVQEDNQTVTARAVQKKKPHQTTEDILHERNDS